jgi:DNA-binding response OmpR family regulator
MMTMEGELVILLAEDNRADVYLVRNSLKEYGIAHRLIVAEDGEDAIRLIEGVDSGALVVGLVLLDLNLPRKSGREILQRLRDSRSGTAIPVIVITSSDSQSDRMEMIDLGAQAYFRKPSRFEEFMLLGELVKQVVAGS